MNLSLNDLKIVYYKHKFNINYGRKQVKKERRR